jgi:hypothetical protein
MFGFRLGRRDTRNILRRDPYKLETQPQIVAGDFKDYSVQHGATPPCGMKEMFRHLHGRSFTFPQPAVSIVVANPLTVPKQNPLVDLELRHL